MSKKETKETLGLIGIFWIIVIILVLIVEFNSNYTFCSSIIQKFQNYFIKKKVESKIKKLTIQDLIDENFNEKWAQYSSKLGKTKISFIDILSNPKQYKTKLQLTLLVTNKVASDMQDLYEQGIRVQSRVFYFEMYHAKTVIDNLNKQCSTFKAKMIMTVHKYRNHARKAKKILELLYKVDLSSNKKLNELLELARLFTKTCQNIKKIRNSFYGFHDKSLKAFEVYSTDDKLNEHFKNIDNRLFEKLKEKKDGIQKIIKETSSFKRVFQELNETGTIKEKNDSELMDLFFIINDDIENLTKDLLYKLLHGKPLKIILTHLLNQKISFNRFNKKFRLLHKILYKKCKKLKDIDLDRFTCDNFLIPKKISYFLIFFLYKLYIKNINLISYYIEDVYKMSPFKKDTKVFYAYIFANLLKENAEDMKNAIFKKQTYFNREVYLKIKSLFN